MPYPVKDYRQIRADILRDISNRNPAADVSEDSDFYIRATGTGNAIEGLYQHQQWIARQLMPDTADLDWLIRHAAIRGLKQKLAARATGTIQISGDAGTAVPIGTSGQTNAGISYVTTAAAVIGAGGTVNVSAQAVVAALAGNQAANTPVTLSNAPPGIQGAAVILSMTGGADVETPAELLARLLFEIQMPPHGGSPADYFRWALEVPGVTDAYVFKQRRTANSVDVVIEASGGLPSSALLAQVTAYITDNSRMPPCVDFLVLAPQLVPINIEAQPTLSGITLADATTRFTSLLQAYFGTLGVGDSIVQDELISLFMSISGVKKSGLITPAADVAILADSTHAQLATLGTIYIH